MPRWPAGLHLASQSVRATGTSPRRIERTPQRAYWRHTVADLNAGGTAVVLSPPITFPLPGQPIQQTTTTVRLGPQAVGERWDVTMVQVQTGSQTGLPPLVTQQISAQQSGLTTAPPPPIACRVWRAVSGVPVHLLGFTNQGGYDTLGITCPPLCAGEQILVVWYAAAVGDSVQAIVKGTLYAIGL